MFTGIITQKATIVVSHTSQKGLELTIKKPLAWHDVKLGESIATNGVCLTVAKIHKDAYDVFLMPETLSKTMFGKHVPPMVNLERSLSVVDRLGGHFVQGHVDTTGTVSHVDKTNGCMVEVTYSKEFTPYVIPKGSITIDGVALTVVTSSNGVLRVALIPHTLDHTTLGTLQNGDIVNLEFDMLGKYVINYMKENNATS